MTIRMQQEDKLIRTKELCFLVRGNPCLLDQALIPPVTWLSETSWRDAVYLAAWLPRSFAHLPSELQTKAVDWRAWLASNQPELQTGPGSTSNLRPVQQLCLLRCLRMDRIPAGLRRYIQRTMGKAYVNPPQPNLNDVVTSTSPTVPIILIVKPGCDPTQGINDLAAKMEMTANRVKYLSMGQGQEIVRSCR
ncbi:unnamed protein product [Protopolystoma xenopodis]|uniref:Dynein heavy chain region D6 P-loop domain-containing protein n=1 Tax=Protopolystoma xenopodis TaxID=117903 RepID=A0A3S5A3J5_9PLAT|nr:unnamed protein product [Protopolystoma xenopodis]